MAIVATLRCDCCCSSKQEYTDEDVNFGYMRCLGCSCSRRRTGSASELVIRVQIGGLPSLQIMEQATEMARLLGAPDDITMKIHDGMPYFELSGNAASAALEIHMMRQRRRQSVIEPPRN